MRKRKEAVRIIALIKVQPEIHDEWGRGGEAENTKQVGRIIKKVKARLEEEGSHSRGEELALAKAQDGL